MKKINYEELRENLVENLSDMETIKAYLHRKKYSKLELLKEGLKPFKDNRKIKFQLLGYSLSTGLIPILDAFILYYLVDMISSGKADAQAIIKISGIFALVFVGLNILSTQLNYRVKVSFTRVRMKMLSICSDKIMTMDFGLGENPDFIDEAQRYIYAFASNDSGIEGVYNQVFELGGHLVAFIVLGLILTYLSPLVLILSILAIGFYVFIKEKISAYKHQRIEKLNLYRRRSMTVTDLAVDFKHGKDTRLYGFTEKLKEILRENFSLYMDFYKFITRPQVVFALPLALAIVLIEGLGLYYMGQKIIRGELSLAQVSLFASSVILFTRELDQVAKNLDFIRDQIKFFADGLDMMKADLVSFSGKETLDDSENLDIVFDQVSFSYPGSDKKVFENLSFKIDKGQRLALVGVNGAGKTTFVKLALGLYKPTSGKIYINGIDSDKLDIKERFKAFSAVLQETEPLALSIAENVSASSLHIDRKRVYQSLVKAGLKKKIDLLPHGIDTQMTKIIDEEGTLFSGGENQKLDIARALYKKDYKALILDEPTASLDALAEEKIYKELDQIVGNKTLIFISHRLASTSFCDKIALLDGGRIKEYGSHQELMDKDGLYKKMFTTQAKYYKE